MKESIVQVPDEKLGRLTFTRPPVIEVVLGVQFEPLQDFRMRHIGELYRLYQDEFPSYEEHPPLKPLIESFRKESGGLHIEWTHLPPMPRVWFVKQSGHEVIQIQRDRFLHNWRRTETGDDYPSYEVCRDIFCSSLEVFLSFIRENNCGDWLPNQCELTYINHVRQGELWKDHSRIAGVIRAWCDQDDPVPENVSLTVQYVISDLDNRPVGRVHLAVKPKWRLPERSPLLEFSLTARGRPAAQSLDGVLEFLDQGHAWERKVFLANTSDEIQKEWGLTWTS